MNVFTRHSVTFLIGTFAQSKTSEDLKVSVSFVVSPQPATEQRLPTALKTYELFQTNKAEQIIIYFTKLPYSGARIRITKAR